MFACVRKKNTLIGNDLKLEVSVIDEGVGMTEEEAKHVFDPFYKSV